MLWTVAHQAALSMGFSRQEYCNGLPYPPPGDLPNPRMEPTSINVTCIGSGFLPLAPPGNTLQPGSRQNQVSSFRQEMRLKKKKKKGGSSYQRERACEKAENRNQETPAFQNLGSEKNNKPRRQRGKRRTWSRPRATEFRGFQGWLAGQTPHKPSWS